MGFQLALRLQPGHVNDFETRGTKYLPDWET